MRASWVEIVRGRAKRKGSNRPTTRHSRAPLGLNEPSFLCSKLNPSRNTAPGIPDGHSSPPVKSGYVASVRLEPSWSIIKVAAVDEKPLPSLRDRGDLRGDEVGGAKEMLHRLSAGASFGLFAMSE
ncbi:hypothetical protein NL676_023488 [Syzygium grande]|nr:hypothetical protein NL676_023488 [Syzygium grande]